MFIAAFHIFFFGVVYLRLQNQIPTSCRLTFYEALYEILCPGGNTVYLTSLINNVFLQTVIAFLMTLALTACDDGECTC